MIRSIKDFEKVITAKINNDQLESALFSIKAFVEQVIFQVSSAGHVIGAAELDQLCQQIGLKTL